METTTTEQKTQTKSTLGVVGWVLFAIGLVLMFNSLVYAMFYIPIFIACFIIAIILIAQKSIGSGVTLLLLDLILVPILWFGLVAYNVTDAIETSKKEAAEVSASMLQNIRFEDIKIYTRGDYMYCDGKIRNNGKDSYNYVKVKVEWLDKNGVILDTDYTFAVSGEDFLPGEAKSFSIMTREDRRMESGRYSIME